MNVSVDIEEDIALYLTHGRFGLEEGLPRLLDLLAQLRIHADMFLQGNLVDSLSSFVKEACQRGHRIGLHGARHEARWPQSTVGSRALQNASAALAELTGTKPTTHRTPNFRLGEVELRVLEQAGILLDSSILPNARHVRLRGRWLIRSYEGAPRTPYHPSPNDVTRPGNSKILEVPLTENPDFPSAPLGLGYLNTFGLDATQVALSKVREPYATFLIHTWEAVDLGDRNPRLPNYVRRECSRNLEPLGQFLGGIQDRMAIASLEEIGTKLTAGVGPS